MKLWAKRLIVSVAGLAVVWMIGIAWAGQAAPQGGGQAAAKAPTAGETFKNVTTPTLKVLTVSDFLGAMGVVSAALGYDCADCHPSAGTDKVDWVFDTPKKKRARLMIEMVGAINKANFGGVQMVTCWTCHRGNDLPTTTITLDKLYGTPNDEKRDIILPAPANLGLPSATQILDRYIQAVGGAQRVAGLKSFIATGKSEGYGGLGGGGTFQIFAQAPDHRATVIEFKEHPERGKMAWTFDGKDAWMTSPRGLLGEFQLTGNDVDGARLDALLAFPGQIKTAMPNWRAGNLDIVHEKDVYVVQGSAPKGLLVTLYFDKQTNLLVREVRYTPTPIGRVPIQSDFDDYRDVGGIKFPFKYTYSWLDGRDSFELSDVKTNVPVDAAKFGKP
jgi:hypothetical protein